MIANVLRACPAAAIGLGVAVFMLGASPAAASAPENINGATTVDADGVIELVSTRTDLVILDNRREADYAAGHIEGAVRLIDSDITGPDVLAQFVPSADTPVLFYCNGLSCGRAAAAVEMAVGWDYSNVYYYALGMEEWRDLGLPLVSQ